MLLMIGTWSQIIHNTTMTALSRRPSGLAQSHLVLFPKPHGRNRQDNASSSLNEVGMVHRKNALLGSAVVEKTRRVMRILIISMLGPF